MPSFDPQDPIQVGGITALGMWLLQRASRTIREWGRDRNEQKVEDATVTQIKALQLENQELRQKWAQEVEQRAELNSKLGTAITQLEQAEQHIEYLTKLVEHLITINGSEIPPGLKEAGMPFASRKYKRESNQAGQNSGK